MSPWFYIVWFGVAALGYIVRWIIGAYSGMTTDDSRSQRFRKFIGWYRYVLMGWILVGLII